MMTPGLALLAIGFLAVCLTMIVLGWTLDMVWVVGKQFGASVDARTKVGATMTCIDDRRNAARRRAASLNGTSSGRP
jgi:hypothetical protein